MDDNQNAKVWKLQFIMNLILPRQLKLKAETCGLHIFVLTQEASRHWTLADQTQERKSLNPKPEHLLGIPLVLHSSCDPTVQYFLD
jgi:hypothetical protein